MPIVNRQFSPRFRALRLRRCSIGVFEDAAGELEDLVLPQSGGVPPFVRSNRHPAAKGRLPDVQRLSRPT